MKARAVLLSLAKFAKDHWKWTLVVSVLAVAILRAVISPAMVDFPNEADYAPTILSGILSIALDAMIVMALSWSTLRCALDVVLMATLVGLTHALFPLGTFGLTVGASWGVRSLGLPAGLEGGVQTAIFATAFALLLVQLKVVHSGLYDTDAELFELKVEVKVEGKIKTKLWRRIATKTQEVRTVVLAVSVDAALVGPAKIAFMERYSTSQFLWSFAYVGGGVFALVAGTGAVVLYLKKFTERSATFAHHIDWIGRCLLVVVFTHLAILVGMYVLFPFVRTSWFLLPVTVWGIVAVGTGGYIAYRVNKIREASQIRVGLTPAIA